MQYNAIQTAMRKTSGTTESYHVMALSMAALCDGLKTAKKTIMN